jgi:DNA-binding response OmpR family regulator
MKILCIDDDPVFLDIIKAKMHHLGHPDVETAESAQAALNLVKDGTYPVDCFLVDIRMPDKDGIELCRDLRSFAQYRHTPIVMVTRMSDRSYVDQAFAAGATDYLTKPLDDLELKARIGMIQRFHEQRKLNISLAEQNAQSGDSAVPIDFGSPFLIPETDNAVEYFALENYLLTLRKVRLMGCSALAIHLSNAEFLHRVSGNMEFSDIITDVTHSIHDALKAQEFLISYAGHGNFVTFFPKRSHLDMENLETEINHNLQQFEVVYSMDRMPTPTVKVGQMVTNNVFTPGRANRMLSRAISFVQENSDCDQIQGRLIA